MKPELVPLSIGQKAVAYTSERWPGIPFNNIGGLMLLEDQLDYNLMASH